MDASSLKPLSLPHSRRLLGALSDDRLAAQAQRGNQAAFEAIYDRYHRPLLSFCRHMLGSREDSEDALQHVFASAFRALPRDQDPTQLKPWLYTIARNRCLSILRARRELPVAEVERASTAGLSEEAEHRAEVRELLADLEGLPEHQRAALVLAEIGDLAHDQIAQILECETKRVKALVFQARTNLIESRRGRETSCAEIREQIATATGRGLRRSTIRRHLQRCPGCSEYAAEVRRQRALLGVALPVVPSLGLKESVLAGAGIGGGGAAGGGGLIAALGANGAVKVVGVAIATGSAVGGAVIADRAPVGKARAAVERPAQATQSAGSGDDPSSSNGASREGRAGRSFGWQDEIDNARRGNPAGGPSPQSTRSEGADVEPGGDRALGAAPAPAEEHPGRGHAKGREEAKAPPGARSRGVGRGTSPQNPRSEGGELGHGGDPERGVASGPAEEHPGRGHAKGPEDSKAPPGARSRGVGRGSAPRRGRSRDTTAPEPRQGREDGPPSSPDLSGSGGLGEGGEGPLPKNGLRLPRPRRALPVIEDGGRKRESDDSR